LLLFVFTLNLVSGYLMAKQSAPRAVEKKSKQDAPADPALTLKGA